MAIPGFHDESDPNVAPDQFEKFPKGEVVVSGIYSYVYLDDQGVPFFKERDGRPQTMLRLRLADGSEGPPMSATPAELALIVVAFAGEIYLSKLPAVQTSAQYLMVAKALANCETEEQKGKAPTRQTAYVGERGYVSSLSGMSLPTDRMFRFALDDIRNLDGTTSPLHFLEMPAFHQAVLALRFRVVGDMLGNKTLYDGATVKVLLENPFNGTYEGTDSAGMSIRTPKFKVNDNRSQPKSVARLLKFVEIFCPEIIQGADGQGYGWVSDPTRSSYGTDEAANPIVVIADHALRGGRQAIGKLSVSPKSKTKQPRLDLAELVGVDGLSAGVTQTASGVAQPAPVASQPVQNELETLYATIRRMVQKEKNTEAFLPNSIEFTQAGKDWAQERLAKIWDFLGFPKPRALGNLKPDQAQALNAMLLGLEAQPPATTGPLASPELNKPTSEF